MPVKHGLLALLAQRDLTGYELKSRFERALGDFWQLNSGQVYSTLERLRRARLVERTGEAAASPRNVERARYRLLPSGRHQLERWLAAPACRLRPIRDPLFVKLVFAPPERLPALLTSFAAEARRYSDVVETLTALLAQAPVSRTSRTRWLVVEATRLQYEAQLRWLDTVHGLLAPLAAAPAPLARPTRRGPRRPPPRAASRAALAGVPRHPHRRSAPD